MYLIFRVFLDLNHRSGLTKKGTTMETVGRAFEVYRAFGVYGALGLGRLGLRAIGLWV